MFTKSDLKENDWVVLRDGEMFRVIQFKGEKLFVNDQKCFTLDYLSEDLLGKSIVTKYDVMKVVRPLSIFDLTKSKCNNGKTVFNRYKGIGCEPTPKFKVEDYVKVIDPNKAFVLYRDFINENAPKLADNFIEWGKPNTFSKFIVEAVAKHPDRGCFTYAIKDIHSLQAFVISEDGLEKIE